MSQKGPNPFQWFFQSAPVGFAQKKVIFSSHRKPEDFIFQDINPAFEQMTGLSYSQIIGKSFRQLFPNQDITPWIVLCQKAIEHNGEQETVQSFRFLGRQVLAKGFVQDSERFFLTLSFDAQEPKRVQDTQPHLPYTIEGIGVPSINNQIRLLSGAVYSVFNLYDEDNLFCRTVDIAGEKELLVQISKEMGSSILGKRWRCDPDHTTQFADRAITRFAGLIAYAGAMIPPLDIARIEALLDIGEIVVIPIKKARRLFGYFTLFMKPGADLENEHLLEPYAQQVGLLLTHSIAERKLKKTQAQLMNIISNVPGIVFRSKFQGEEPMELVSDGSWALTGYASDDPIFASRTSFSSMIHPDDRESVRLAIEKAVETNTSYEVIYRIHTQDGAVKWIQERGQLVWEKEGQIWLDGVMVDITQQQEAQRQQDMQTHLQNILLRISNTFINEPLESIGSAIQSALHDLASFVGADRAYIYDYDFEKLTCTNTFEWCAPGILPQIDHMQNVSLNIQPEWVRAHRKGNSISLPNLASLPSSKAKKSLQSRQIQSLIAVPMMKEGECVGFVGFDSVRTTHRYSDMEESLLDLFTQMLVNLKIRQESQAQLRKSEGQYRAIAEDTPAMICRSLPDTRHEFVNRAYCEYYGRTPESLLGTPFLDLIPHEQRERVRRNLAQLTKESPSITHEHQADAPDGKGIRWHRWTNRALFDDDGRLVSYQSVGIDITEERNVQDALRLAHERLQTVIDSLDATIYIADMDSYEVLLVNRYGSQKWGDFTGTKCWQTMHKDQSGPCSFCPNHRLLDPEGTPTGIHRWEHRNQIDGRWYECWDQAIEWVDGRMVHMAVASDITERKVMELELRNSKERYQDLFRAGIEGLAIHDEGVIREVNPSLERMLGYAREELVGKLVTQFVHPDDQNITWKFKNQDYPVPIELRMFRKNGEMIFVEAEAKDFLFEGKNMRITGIQDITRRKIAEEAIIEQSQFNEMASKLSKSFISAIPSTISQKVQDMLMECGKFFHVDRTYVFRVSEDGQTFSNAYEWRALDIPPQKESLQEVPASGLQWMLKQMNEKGYAQIDASERLSKKEQQEQGAFDHRLLIDRSGKRGVQTMLVVPLFDLRGSITGFFGLDTIRSTKRWNPEIIPLIQVLADLLSDAFHKVRLEEEWLEARHRADEANRAKSRFVSNISHEIRTPLNSVIGFSHLLEHTSMSPQQYEYVGHISSSAKTLLALVSDILDLSKIEAGRMEVQQKPASIEEVCKTALGSVQIAAESKNLSIQLEIHPSLRDILIVTDPDRLRQVLVNLLGNAVKFTSEGAVSLIASLEQSFKPNGEGSIRFSVRDSGPGIDHRDQPRLFEEFYQVDSSSTRRFGGAGLGLAISQRILKLMDTRLQLVSQPGRGTTFSFLIKARKILDPPMLFSAESSVPSKRKNSIAAGWQEKEWIVLIAEDHSLNMKLIKALLSKNLPRATIIEAKTGREAVDQTRKKTPDLILMDLLMPEMDGIQAAKSIRDEERQGHIPIIALTAAAETTDRTRCFEAGMDGYLTKPIVLGDLLSELQKWFEQDP